MSEGAAGRQAEPSAAPVQPDAAEGSSGGASESVSDAPWHHARPAFDEPREKRESDEREGRKRDDPQDPNEPPTESDAGGEKP